MFEEKQKKLPEVADEIVSGFAETGLGILGARRIVANMITAIARFNYILLEYNTYLIHINLFLVAFLFWKFVVSSSLVWDVP